MLHLYTNTDFLTEKHRKEVFPLLFDLVFKKNDVLLGKYQLVDAVSKADVVVFPIDYSVFITYKTEFSALLKQAKSHNKPIWVYTAGDYGFTNYIANAYTFRLGGFDSKLGENTFILPSFIDDPYQSFINQKFKPLQKEDKPTIGFVGHAQSGFSKYIKEYGNYIKYRLKRIFKRVLADKQPFYPSSIKRAKYLLQLASNKDLNTNFLFRNKYRAGLQNAATQKESSQQFYENICENGYTFCLRGVGNFSVRFYETLAVGRIPVVINTDCRFPLNHTIDWEKHCLIIDAHTKKNIAEYILEFHNSLSNAEFKNIQTSNRNLWLKYLQREAYFMEIYKYFKSKF